MQADTPAEGSQQPTLANSLPAPSAATAAFAASVAARHIAADEVADDARPAARKHGSSSAADAEWKPLLGNAEEEHVTASSAADDSVPVEVHASAASRPVVDAAESGLHDMHSQGDPQRRTAEQQPAPQTGALHLAADIEAEHRSSSAGHSHQTEEQPERWKTLTNGIGDDDRDAVTAVAADASGTVTGQLHSLDIAASLPARSALSADRASMQADTPTGTAPPAAELDRAPSSSYDEHRPKITASLEDRSQGLASALETTNGVSNGQPSAAAQAGPQSSAANGDAQPAHLTNGPDLLEPVTLDDADAGPAAPDTLAATDHGAGSHILPGPDPIGVHLLVSIGDLGHNASTFALAGRGGRSHPEPRTAPDPAPEVSSTSPLHGASEPRVRQLQEALAARELQLERKSDEVSQVQALCDQLQARRWQQAL